VEHGSILKVLKHLGFGDKWISWFNDILRSGTSVVLLNGIPEKTIRCERGLRQGDSLSPLLFALVADLLQAILNLAKSMGLLNLPIRAYGSQDFHIVQYADDTLIIMEGDARQLGLLKAPPELFCNLNGSES